MKKTHVGLAYIRLLTREIALLWLGNGREGRLICSECSFQNKSISEKLLKRKRILQRLFRQFTLLNILKVEHYTVLKCLRIALIGLGVLLIKGKCFKIKDENPDCLICVLRCIFTCLM